MTNKSNNFHANETPISQDGCPCFHENSRIEAAVTEAARKLQVSREMAMMCAFGAMATACQGQIDVEMPTGHQVATSLMLLTIAESGERKTTTQNYFFDAINTLNNDAYRANEEAQKEYRVEQQLWGTHKRHLERMYSRCAAKEDKDATRAALEAIREFVKTEPQPAPSGKFLYEDTTPPALVQMLYENSPNGCLLTSEANSIFSGKALGELDKLNTLWDGGSLIVDRVSREGFILQNARLTLSLMAQPSVVARFMGKRGEEARGTGFLARFLVIKPYSMAGQRSGEPLSELPRKQAFNNRVRELLTIAAPANRQTLRFSESASDTWYKYSQHLEEQMQVNGLYYYLKDHASKLLENVSRLAAVLHAFERKSDDDIDINQQTLEFCWKFALHCSKHFIENLANEPMIVTDANLLAHYLLRAAYKKSASAPTKSTDNSSSIYITPETDGPSNYKEGAQTSFTLTDIKQYGPSSLRGRASSDRLDAAIGLLTRLGHIKQEGSLYQFKETILLQEEPELKNGEIINIKELPLFRAQRLLEPQRANTYNKPTYHMVF
ncbi:YfjI family protein [Pseudomonas nitroreducens]|uniref:YfjI family protein n=1 Tax=Pseudomonas nitroreducens TaxID=46680 RepID=UPI003D2B5F69